MDIGTVAPGRNSSLLHQVKHFRKLRFELQCLLNLVCCRVWILSVLQKARALVFTNELDESWYVRLPVLGKTFKVLENCVHADLFEKGYCILGVLVEICIEDSLVHEVRVLSNIEENPPKVVQLERFQYIGYVCNRFLDGLAVAADRVLSSRLDLRDYGESMAGRSSWIYRAVSPVLEANVSLLRNRHCCRFRPIADFFFGCRG